MQKENVKYMKVNIDNKFYNINKDYFESVKDMIVQERRNLILEHEDTYEININNKPIYSINVDNIIINQWVELRSEKLCINLNNEFSEEEKLLEFLSFTQSKMCIVYVFDKTYCLVKTFNENKYFIVNIVNLIKDNDDKRKIAVSNYNILNEVNINHNWISVHKRTDNSAILKNFGINNKPLNIGFFNTLSEEVGISLPLINEKDYEIVIPIQMIIDVLRIGVSASYSYNKKHINQNRLLGITRYEYTIHKTIDTVEKEYNQSW